MRQNRVAEFIRDAYAFFKFFVSPGVIVAIVLIETIYWTSPEWAQDVGLPTEEGSKAKAITACTELLAKTCKSEVVHDSGVPIPPEGLPEWTPIRVEQRFTSGLTVVSLLGPHENFQYMVRDLTLPEGTIFRVAHGAIVRTNI